MSAQRPLSFVFRADVRKDQPARRQTNNQKNWIRLLLGSLALFLLLILPASTLSINQARPPVSFPPLQPVGEVAIVNAPGFDTCVAPPAHLLATWWDKSPYRWLNVYLGGVSMFHTCGGKNLTPEWVRTVYEQGWSFLPTWVGLQAPCAAQHAVMSRDATVSYAQGQFEAAAAIEAADRLGFSGRTPIYFDMEHFNPTRKNGSRDTGCIQAVNAFLDGWNDELSAHNHLAGVYASASNYPVLVSSTMTVPLVAWIAGGATWAEKYDAQCSVYGNRYVSDAYWNPHQRIYQYTGGHNETYGHKTWNIDSDCADAPMIGHITTISIEVGFQH